MAKLAKARDCNVVQVILRSGVRVPPGRKFFFFFGLRADSDHATKAQNSTFSYDKDIEVGTFM